MAISQEGHYQEALTRRMPVEIRTHTVDHASPEYDSGIGTNEAISRDDQLNDGHSLYSDIVEEVDDGYYSEGNREDDGRDGQHVSPAGNLSHPLPQASQGQTQRTSPAQGNQQLQRTPVPRGSQGQTQRTSPAQGNQQLQRTHSPKTARDKRSEEAGAREEGQEAAAQHKITRGKSKTLQRHKTIRSHHVEVDAREDRDKATVQAIRQFNRMAQAMYQFGVVLDMPLVVMLCSKDQ
ncbi:hypothetical protein N7507_007614 [Penicillium longicatenatum]|nr:hypothetical protein N7507_007614 [Penicillium longicatenatum]